MLKYGAETSAMTVGSFKRLQASEIKVCGETLRDRVQVLSGAKVDDFHVVFWKRSLRWLRHVL